MAPAAKTSPPRDVGPRSSPPRQSGRPAAAPATRADSGAPEQSGAEKGRSGPSQAGASGRTGGRGASSPGIRSADAEALASRYLGELRRAIGKHRRYPPQARRRGETGTVSVAFVLHGNGRISGVRVASSSGSATLDKAATDALNRMGRFKPIPKQLARSSWPIRVPIQFQLH